MLPDDVGRDVRGSMPRQHSLVVCAEVAAASVQESDGELLVPVQIGDDLTHRLVVASGAGCGDHEVDVIAADLPLEARLLAAGDQVSSVGGNADMLLVKTARERRGAGRGRD